jgi:hypothetical protein
MHLLYQSQKLLHCKERYIGVGGRREYEANPQRLRGCLIKDLHLQVPEVPDPEELLSSDPLSVVSSSDEDSSESLSEVSSDSDVSSKKAISFCKLFGSMAFNKRGNKFGYNLLTTLRIRLVLCERKPNIVRNSKRTKTFSKKYTYRCSRHLQ